MAKSKKEPIESEVMEEVVEETIEESVTKPVAPSFIERKLKLINEMENRAKAERLAHRLLRKRRG